VSPRRTSSETQQQPGSPSSGEPVFLAVGKLGRTYGIKGEMFMDVLTDFPERLKPGMTLYAGQNNQPLKLCSLRPHGGKTLVAFEGASTREQAQQLVNQVVKVRAEGLPDLPEGEYYHHQLLGLRVFADDGQELGRLEQILETGANEVYLVRAPDGQELLLPAIDEVILAIDLDKGEVHVHLLPGLLAEQ
jgi:16S rRNA processing protein RimM